MAQATLGPRPVRRSLAELAIDRVWRFFCSVRIAIWEIAALAVLVLIGTLRGSSVPRALTDAVPLTTPLVERWYAWDVFHSLLFMALLALLSVAIAIGGALNRAPGIWAAIARPTVATTHGFLRNAETSATIASPLPPAELARRLATGLRGGRYRVLTQPRGSELHFYADRFRFARLATFPFHLALIMILLGGIVGARWGFRDTEFIVPEGSTRAIGHGTDLSLRLDDFSETYLESGAPAEYRSDLTLLRGGEPVESGSITVNHPLSHDNLTIYQASFGQAVQLRISDEAGNLLFDDALPLGPYRSAINPDAPAARLDLPPVGMALSVIAHDLDPANAPELDTLNLRPGQMYLLLRPAGPDSPITVPTGVTITQGQTRDFVGLRFDFVREKRFSLLQIAHNPGIPIFYAASFLLVGGLAVTFYFPHRRLRGIVSPAPGGGSVAALAPMAKRDWSARRAFEGVVARLEATLGGEATVERPRREPDEGRALESALPERTGGAVEAREEWVEVEPPLAPR